MSVRASLTHTTTRALGRLRDATATLACRVAERIAGPPRPPGPPPPLGRIAILHFHAIGDLLMATPAIRALARRYPDAQVHVLCRTHCAEILRHNPYVHHARPQGQPPHRRHPRGLLDFGRHVAFLRRGGYDAVVDLTGFSYSAWLTYGSGAPVRIGIAPPGMRAERVWPLYTAAVERDPRRHFIDEYLAVAALLDAPADGDAMDLVVGQEARQAVSAWLVRQALADTRLAVLHPGAKWPPKRWPAERFAALARWLSQDLDLTPILVGNREDAPVFEAIRALAGPLPAFDPRLGLLGLGALLERAALFIGNDSGPMHVALAVGTPSIGIFGPTEPHRSGPRGPGAEALLVPIECRPCRLYYTADTCERGHNFCMDGVPVEAVQRVARRLLEAAPRRPITTAPISVDARTARPSFTTRLLRLARAASTTGPLRVAALGACRAAEALARRYGPLGIILCYHRILADAADGLTPPGLCVRRDDFERQLDYFQARFRFLTPSELLDATFSGRLASPAAALTFDDGFRDNLEIAASVLRMRGIRAAFFLVSDHVGREDWMWQNRLWRTLADSSLRYESFATRSEVPMDPVAQKVFLEGLERASRRPPLLARSRFMMSWDEVRSLQAEGHEIGAHTLSHPNLSRCTPEERRRQIQGSKAAIEAAVATRVRLFSYPFGHAGTWDGDVVSEARAAGFDYAVTTVPGSITPDANPWAIPRVCISREDGMDLMLLKRLAPAYLRHLLRRPSRNGWWRRR